MRALLPLLLAALLALPAAAQRPDPPRSPTADLHVSAPHGHKGGLAFNVTAANASASVHAVVMHEAPPGRPVVDRVVPLDLHANTTAVVAVEGVRFRTNMTVSLVDRSVDLPRLPDVDLLDAPAVQELPKLVESALPPVEETAVNSTVRVERYPVAQGASARLVTTAGGFVVVAYERDQLTLKVSGDGGHTWGPEVVPLPAARQPTSDENDTFRGSNLRWRLAPLPDGRVEVVQQAYNLTVRRHGDGTASEEIERQPWRVAFLDPATLGVTTRDIAPERNITFQVLEGAYALRALSDGTVLFVFHGGAFETDAQGNQIAWWPWGDQLRVWAFGPDGSIGERAAVPLPGGGYHSIIVDADDRDQVAILGWNRQHREGPTLVPWWTVSPDGGRTFAPPRSIEDVYPAEGWFVQPQAMRLGPSGAIHVASVRSPVVDPTVADVTTEVVRLAPGLPTKVTRVDPLSHEGWTSGFFEMARKGPHLWLFWIAQNPLNFPPAQKEPDERWGMESYDDGLTWGPSYVLRDANGSSPATIDASMADDHQSMAPLPDGGPILLTLIDSRSREPPTIAVVPMFDAMPWGQVLTLVSTRAMSLADLVAPVAPPARVVPTPAPAISPPSVSTTQPAAVSTPEGRGTTTAPTGGPVPGAGGAAVLAALVAAAALAGRTRRP